MKKSELYQKILRHLTGYLQEKGLFSDDEETKVQENLDLYHYADVCDDLSEIDTVRLYQKMITWISEGIDNENDIRNPLPARHLTASDEKKLKEFCYTDNTSLAVMPAKCIVKVMQDNTSEDLEEGCHKILELICCSYIDKPNELNYLWECFQGKHNKDYFLLTEKRSNAKSNWRLFSYAYFCFVNFSKLEIPQKLIFKEKVFAPKTKIKYDAANAYEQYFDVYNVMNESKYATDVLTRYLRLYQILEYLGYRKMLADMTKGNIKENGFVRNVISKASKGSANELNELKNGLKDSFPLATIIADGDITEKQKRFIKDKLMVKNTNHDDAGLWEIIYKFRNCIVHNKESELHFTFANTDVYADGISLMKLLIKKLEPALVDVINNHEKTNFDFKQEIVKLY